LNAGLAGKTPTIRPGTLKENLTMPSDQSLPRVWIITGTSQGLGHHLVDAALKRGDRVVATSRDPQKVQSTFPNHADRLLAISMDLRDRQQIAQVVDTTIERFGRIDVLVNNAGHGLLGAVEEVSEEEIKSVFETNVFGLIRVTQAVLPQMRKQRSGHIVNLSSIGGLIGIPGWGIYNATKFAVEGLSEALAHELKPLGIGVTIVEPGPFRTDFLGGSLSMVKSHLPDYAQTAGQTRKYQKENDGSQAGDPARGAKAMVDAVVGPNPPLHLPLGAIAFQRGTAKFAALQKEFDAWRDVALATDFPK
jgi:NAD(P)-dependent dehydrogenase (short-subunit alcohol dehydrogenase family)